MRIFALYSEYTDAFHIYVDGTSEHLGSLRYSEETLAWTRLYGRGSRTLQAPGSFPNRAAAVLELLRRKGWNYEWLVEEGEDRWLAGVGNRPEPDAVAEGADTGAPASESSAPPLPSLVGRRRLSPAAPATSSTGSPLKKQVLHPATGRGVVGPTANPRRDPDASSLPLRKLSKRRANG